MSAVDNPCLFQASGAQGSAEPPGCAPLEQCNFCIVLSCIVDSHGLPRSPWLELFFIEIFRSDGYGIPGHDAGAFLSGDGIGTLTVQAMGPGQLQLGINPDCVIGAGSPNRLPPQS